MSPAEVFYESFVHHAKGVDFSSLPFVAGSSESVAVGAAFKTARESLLFHLIRDLGWREGPAGKLMAEFTDTGLAWLADGTDKRLTALKEQLNHVWTDWCLRRGA